MSAKELPATDNKKTSEQPVFSSRLPTLPFISYLIASGIVALAYGSSFLLTDTLAESGLLPTDAGSIVSIGVVATLLSSLFAGRFAQWSGLMPAMAIASFIMALAMICFGLIGTIGMTTGYIGGVLFGMGWAVFYMLAPIQLIKVLAPEARVEALTLLSGAQMIGIGFSAPFGKLLAQWSGMPSLTYNIYAVLCLTSAAALLTVGFKFKHLPHTALETMALSFAQVKSILTARTIIPVVMVGLAACTFTGLSTFQSFYGQSRNLSPSLFFLTFTTTTVVLRFSLARFIGRLPLLRLMCLLFILILSGLILLTVNSGNVLLYIFASWIYATGYGLTYASLNAMAVNLAGECGVSVSGSSQVFTLGYFTGLFGFPYIAGILIERSGIDTVLHVMIGIILLNLCAALLLAAGLRFPSHRRAKL